jgi:hypothetical protein
LNPELFILPLQSHSIVVIAVVLERNWFFSKSLNIKSESHGSALVFILRFGQVGSRFPAVGISGEGAAERIEYRRTYGEYAS